MSVTDESIKQKLLSKGKEYFDNIKTRNREYNNLSGSGLAFGGEANDGYNNCGEITQPMFNALINLLLEGSSTFTLLLFNGTPPSWHYGSYYRPIAAPPLFPKSITTLLKALNKNASVTHLIFWGFHERISYEGVEALATGLATNQTLVYLDLEGNRIGSQGIQVIVRALLKNNKISYLGLRGNDLNDDDVKTLAEVLATNVSLTHLDLSANNITCNGAKILANALTQKCSLIKLNLEGNKIGDIGAEALAQGLNNNHTLLELYLGNNNIKFSSSSFTTINFLLTNLTLRKLDLRENQIPQEKLERPVNNLELSRNYTLELHLGHTMLDQRSENISQKNKELLHREILTYFETSKSKLPKPIINTIYGYLVEPPKPSK